MDTGNRQHLQDIYATEPKSSNDYAPQISSEVQSERKREMQRQQFTTFFLGALVLLVVLVIAFLVVKQTMTIEEQAPTATAITTEYIPRYSLARESQWVLDLDRSFGDPKWDGEGERPFNATWLKKATFNLILAEQAYTIKEYGEAAEYYENALEIFPELENVKVPLGLTYFQLKQFDKAMALLDGVPADDLTFDVLNNLGAACLDAKAYAKAESYLKKALELKPAYAEALKNLAVLYKDQKREAEAIASFEQYLDQRPADDSTRHMFALYLTQIGNWETAAEQLRELTKHISDEAQIYYLLARAETKLGNLEAALDASRRASELISPEQALAYMSDKQFDKLRESEEGFRQLEHSLKRSN